MKELCLIILALLFLLFSKRLVGYCVREFDMWCSSQAPSDLFGYTTGNTQHVTKKIAIYNIYNYNDAI